MTVDGTDNSTLEWRLSGFGDEIAEDPVVQLSVLQALGARHLEFRSAWGTNVIDLTNDDVERLKRIFTENGMGISAIGSPIGKIDLAVPVEHEVERLKRIVRVAGEFGTPYVRVFSFFRPAGADETTTRDEVLRRMRALAVAAERAGVILLHENEKGLFGDTPARCLDIVESVGSASLKVAWDSANFVQAGVARPFDEGYALLRPYFEYLQVKDARAGDMAETPAGEGDGQLRETLAALRDDGYTGFASLEPHLAEVHNEGGNGAAEFGRAARALRGLTDSLGVSLV